MASRPAPSPPDGEPQSVREVALSDSAAATSAAAAGPVEDESAAGPPAYYIATRPLFIGGQFGRAFNAGDRVPADHVEAYGWAEQVRRPDESEQPSAAAPHTMPETASGQATSKEGDA
ncbi:hypothetical protein ACLQ2R_17270 [Streptosporangium sp. DT93]|uniref:hypothetical protein n=1 Tax=Streptosporangium sp. DT93 TaxID=3393428 RepID=UPI003CF0A880